MSPTVEAITGSARDSLHEVKDAVHRATKSVEGVELHRHKKVKRFKTPMLMLLLAATVVAALVPKKVRERGDDSHGADGAARPTKAPTTGDGTTAAGGAEHPMMHAVPDYAGARRADRSAQPVTTSGVRMPFV